MWVETEDILEKEWASSGYFMVELCLSEKSLETAKGNENEKK